MNTILIALGIAFAALVIVRGAVAVKETWSLGLTAVETQDATTSPLATSSGNTLTYAITKNETNDGSSVAGRAVKLVAQGRILMTAGAATLNFAAAPGTAGETSVNLTGHRIRRMVIRALSDNANPITITFGAANGYTGFGAAFSVTLAAGKHVLLEGNATAVASGIRTLDISGTGTQGLDFIATAGDN